MISRTVSRPSRPDRPAAHRAGAAPLLVTVMLSAAAHAGAIALIAGSGESTRDWPRAGGVVAIDVVIVDGPESAPDAAASPVAPRDETEPARQTGSPRHDGAAAPPGPPEKAAETAPPADIEPEAEDADPAIAAVPAALHRVTAPPAHDAPVRTAPRLRKPRAIEAARPPSVEPARSAASYRTAKPVAASPAATAVAVTGHEAPIDSDAGPQGAGRQGAGPRGAAPRGDNAKPVYPFVARRRGIEGRVVLRVRVHPDGTAGRIEVARSSGHRRLDDAARDAVMRWRFIPAARQGVTVAADLLVPIRFSLR